jgi:hypothetical protein
LRGVAGAAVLALKARGVSRAECGWFHVTRRVFPHLAIRASRQPYGYVDETIILPITAYEVRRPRRQQP